MTPNRPPGWYADPDGVPGRLRWWDGSGWTDMTLGRAAQSPPPPPTDPAGHPASPGQTPTRAATRWARVAAPLVVTGLVLAVVVNALPHSSAGGDRSRSIPTYPHGSPPIPALPVPSLPPAPPTESPTAPTYTAARIVDPAAGLSYLRPPGSWRPWDPTDMLLFGLGTAGVYQVTQRNIPGGGFQRAAVVSGPLLPVVTYHGPVDLPMAATQLAESLERVYYPDHTRRTLAAKPLAVERHPAYLVRFDVTFDPTVRGYDATSVAVAVVVVDTGRPAPGVLYVSLPDTRRQLWPEIDRVVGSLAVVR